MRAWVHDPMSKTKNWQIKAKLTWHHFGGKINSLKKIIKNKKKKKKKKRRWKARFNLLQMRPNWLLQI
jgi:hypothetical protein